MTNNNVIIYEVDVSKCEYYALHGFCGAEQTTDMKCDDIELHDCYYRQLTCKTQECEMLKEENEQAEVWFKKACKYKSALEEIEEVITPTSLISGKDLSADKVAQIQEIITKAKEQA